MPFSDLFPSRSVFYILLLLLLVRCKVAAPLQEPPIRPTPFTFLDSTDSTSVGDLKWNRFFLDPPLLNLIDTALCNNLDVLTAVQRIEVARSQVLLNGGALLPSLQAVASAGVDKFGDYTMNGVGNYDTNLSDNLTKNQRVPNPTPDYFLGMKSSWEVDLWGKLRNRRKAAYTRLLASQKGRQLLVTSLVAEVASRYYQLLALDNQLAVIQRNIALQQTALEIIKIQKMGGRATELAVQQFTAQWLRTQGLEFTVRQERIAAENQLNLLLGRFPQSIVLGNSILEQQMPESVQVGVPAGMLLRRPDVQQAALELAATRADLDAAHAAFMPSLTISPYVGLNAFKAALLLSQPGSLAYGVLAGLTAPIFQKNQLKSNYKRSQADQLAAFYAYQKVVLNGYQEVVTDLSGIENFRKVYELKEQEVVTLNQAVTVSNDLFTAGYASYLEVITAQRNVLEAELGLANLRKQQFVALIDLYRALGGGWQ